jgi:hypothetical protein
MDKCSLCDDESYYGTHGVRNNELYSEYYCEKCYRIAEKKEADAAEENIIHR